MSVTLLNRNKGSDHLATRETASYILFSAKTQIYKQSTQKVELKSLFFYKVYVFLFIAKTRIYKQNTRTYTQSRAENSLFQFCLTITELFSPFYLEEMKNY